MSFLDKAKDLAGKNPDKVEQGLNTAGDKINDRTGGKYSDHIDTGKDKAGEYLGTGRDEAGHSPEGEQGGQPGQQ